MEIQFYNIYLSVLCPDRHMIRHGYFVSFSFLAVMLYRITGGPKIPLFLQDIVLTEGEKKIVLKRFFHFIIICCRLEKQLLQS